MCVCVCGGGGGGCMLYRKNQTSKCLQLPSMFPNGAPLKQVILSFICTKRHSKSCGKDCDITNYA